VSVPLRALVVDDSAGSRRRVTTLLGLAGWQVVEAVGTRAALHAAAQIQPDLVVTAMGMRDGNGIALLQQLRRRGSRARFLVLTARPDPRLHEVMPLLGGTCLDKPVDPRLFIDFLRGRTTGPAAQGGIARIRVTAERLAGVRTAAPSPAASSPATSSAASSRR
jgi:DNA-binding response OmpR family regulator